MLVESGLPPPTLPCPVYNSRKPSNGPFAPACVYRPSWQRPQRNGRNRPASRAEAAKRSASGVPARGSRRWPDLVVLLQTCAGRGRWSDDAVSLREQPAELHRANDSDRPDALADHKLAPSTIHRRSLHTLAGHAVPSPSPNTHLHLTRPYRP